MTKKTEHISDLTPEDQAAAMVEAIFHRFGGPKAMSKRIRMPQLMIEEWQRMGRIPKRRHNDILIAAQAHRIGVSQKMLELSDPTYKPEEPDPSQDELLKHHTSRVKRGDDTISLRRQRTTYSGPKLDTQQILRKSGLLRFIYTRFWMMLFTFIVVGSLGFVLVGPNIVSLFGSKPITQQELDNILGVDRSKAVKLKKEDLETEQPDISLEDLMAMAKAELQGQLAGLEGADLSIDNFSQSTGLSTDVLVGTLSKFQQAGQAMSAMGNFNNPMGGMQGVLAKLSGNLNEMEMQLLRLKQQNPELAAMLGNVTARDIVAGGLLLAGSYIHITTFRSVPFDQDLNMLKSFVAHDPQLVYSINRLAPFAKRGLASVSQIQSSLGVLGQQQAVSDPTSQQTIENAQSAVQNNDFGQALSLLQGLNGPAGAAAGPVIQQLQGRFQSNQVQDLLSERLQAVLGGS